MMMVISEYLFFQFYNSVHFNSAQFNDVNLSQYIMKIITDPSHFQTRQRLQFTVTKM